jgi:hypothetical protein
MRATGVKRLDGKVWCSRGFLAVSITSKVPPSRPLARALRRRLLHAAVALQCRAEPRALPTHAARSPSRREPDGTSRLHRLATRRPRRRHRSATNLHWCATPAASGVTDNGVYCVGLEQIQYVMTYVNVRQVILQYSSTRRVWAAVRRPAPSCRTPAQLEQRPLKRSFHSL